MMQHGENPILRKTSIEVYTYRAKSRARNTLLQDDKVGIKREMNSRGKFSIAFRKHLLIALFDGSGAGSRAGIFIRR
jgi:hypothetical protein